MPQKRKDRVAQKGYPVSAFYSIIYLPQNTHKSD